MADFHPHTYVQALISHDRYASDRTMLYHWNGSFWRGLDENEGESLAYHWLIEQEYANASPRNANACHRAAVLFVPALPKEQTGQIIPCQNGYVYLNGEHLSLREPDPEAGLQYAISCKYEPDFPAPTRFQKFLDQILPDKEVQARIQEYAGYTLTGDARHQRAQLWLGSGANGKGVLANVLQALHGYVAAVSLNDLDGFKLSVLIGASLVYCDEIPRTKINEQLIKSLIAGERVMVDRKYKDPLSMNLKAKWLVLGNHMPNITDHSVGFWRRWDVVPFTVTIPAAQRDPLLADKIISEELSGVLNWALAGLVRLQARGGFSPELPKALSAFIQEAKVETNSVLAWMTDNEVTTTNAVTVPKTEVYEHYKTWCKSNGVAAQASPRFWIALKDAIAVEEGRKRIGSSMSRVCNLKIGTGQA